MVLETPSVGEPELFNSAPKCTYFAYNGEDAASCSVANAATVNRFDSVEAETSLIRAVYLDSKAELAAQTKRLLGELDRATASELLLPFSTDIRTEDGQEQLALTEAITPSLIEDLVNRLSEKHSRKEIAEEVAYSLAVKGRFSSLTPILIDAAEKVSNSEALGPGGRATPPLGAAKRVSTAGNGNSEALKVLLLEEPDGVQYTTEMEETPLSFVVKNKSEECTKLLLTWGANYEVLNKRKQRAKDLATSQEMRHILLNPTTVSLIDDDHFPYQVALELGDEETTTKRYLNSKAEAEVCNRFVLKQPAACSIGPQAHVTKSSEEPSTPKWLKSYGKWFPGFLQGPSKHSDYALSSLKVDFRAKFGLNLDHSSVDCSKMSDFLKYLPDLCTIIKRGNPNHMILQPSESHFDQESESSKLQGKGTTNIGWVSENFVAIATDARGTIDKRIMGDAYKKFMKITPHIVSTMCGDSAEALNTCLHMKNNIDEKTRNGTDAERVMNVGLVGRFMKKSYDTPTTTFLIAGMQLKVPCCCLLNDQCVKNKERIRELKEILDCISIGSGGEHAEYIVKRMWRAYEKGAAPLSDVVGILNYALLCSCLFDELSGGKLTVISIVNDGLKIETSMTVLELYIIFYAMPICLPRIIEIDGPSQYTPNHVELMTFKSLEGRAVFLFYNLYFCDRLVVQSWLSALEGISSVGHPLTKLRGSYYMHRVVFETPENCATFLGQAEEVNQMSIPFSRSIDDFKYLKHKKQIFFVARQTLQMLEALVISDDMRKEFVLEEDQ